MSYGIWLEVDLCPRCKELDSPEDVSWNYTSNVSPMWQLAMPETDGLAGMAGMLAGDAAEVLSRGLAAMEADPAPYQALNPPNGWGEFHSQFERLHELRRYFVDHPTARVRISR